MAAAAATAATIRQRGSLGITQPSLFDGWAVPTPTPPPPAPVAVAMPVCPVPVVPAEAATVVTPARPKPKPKRRSTPKPPATQVKLVPLKPGKWPALDDQLSIEGLDGLWRFIEPMACGAERPGILVVPWETTDQSAVDPHAPLKWVLTSHVRIRVEKVSPHVRRLARRQDG